MWVEHKTRHSLSIRQSLSRQPHTGNLLWVEHMITTRTLLWVECKTRHTWSVNWTVSRQLHTGTLLWVEHTTTPYLVCQSGGLRLDSHKQGLYSGLSASTAKHLGHPNHIFGLSQLHQCDQGMLPNRFY